MKGAPIRFPGMISVSGLIYPCIRIVVSEDLSSEPPSLSGVAPFLLTPQLETAIAA